ncbi:MAG: NUDIX domain-containing protein [Thaumarchaeota archaeon]|nr:NUDIX domain-containing protein [Nitrososphaerota archaeon]
MVHRRKRGTALVDTPNGILLVSETGSRFSLPGGGARKSESRENAAIRELEEETGLKAIDSQLLFEHTGPIHRSYGGGYYRDIHKVFLILSAGVAKPRKEVKVLAYSTDPNLQLTTATKDIIEKYQKIRNPAKAYTALTCEKDGAPLKFTEHATFIQCEYCKTIYYKGDFFRS